jgi:hypothetical protein
MNRPLSFARRAAAAAADALTWRDDPGRIRIAAPILSRLQAQHPGVRR